MSKYLAVLVLTLTVIVGPIAQPVCLADGGATVGGAAAAAGAGGSAGISAASVAGVAAAAAAAAVAGAISGDDSGISVLSVATTHVTDEPDQPTPDATREHETGNYLPPVTPTHVTTSHHATAVHH
jgi:hypothetical protein